MHKMLGVPTNEITRDNIFIFVRFQRNSSQKLASRFHFGPVDRSHIVHQPLAYSKLKRARRELHKNTLFGYVLILVPKVVGTPRIKSFFDRTRRRRRWSPKVVCGPSVTRARTYGNRATKR